MFFISFIFFNLFYYFFLWRYTTSRLSSYQLIFFTEWMAALLDSITYWMAALLDSITYWMAALLDGITYWMAALLDSITEWMGALLDSIAYWMAALLDRDYCICINYSLFVDLYCQVSGTQEYRCSKFYPFVKNRNVVIS